MKAATRTETNENGPVERLAADDLLALRRWIVDKDVAPADEAVTVADIAEATGLPAAEVQTQLDRIREARAMQAAPAAPRLNQKTLLALAIVLFAGAGAVRLLTPRPLTDDEFDARMQDIIEEKRRHRKPKPITYPIESTIKNGVALPKSFSISFLGRLTKTKYETTAGPLMWKEPEIAALTKAIQEAYAAAIQAEENAPEPKTPLPPPKNSWMAGQQPQPGFLALNLFGDNSMSYAQLPMKPRPGQSAADFAKDVQTQIERLARGVIESAARSQDSSLDPEKMSPRNYVSPPPGFSISFHGRGQVMSGGANNVLVLPIDTARLTKKLDFCLRNYIWQDAMPSNNMFPEQRALEAKRPIPDFAEFEINGPAGNFKFKIPLTASEKYPTAADATRAADGIIKDAVRQAVEQVEKLQEEAKPR